MARVLLLDGDTRQVLPVARALRAKGHVVTVACESRLSLGWLSREPHHRVLVASAEHAPEALLEDVRRLVRSGNYDILIPLFDLCAHLVADHQEELREFVKIPQPDRSVFMQARDKGLTMKACETARVPHPRTWHPDEQSLDTIASEVEYPVLVKPRISHGAMGIAKVPAREDLAATFQRISSAHGPAIVQEFVPQSDRQFKAQLFRGPEGGLHAAVVFSKLRYFPVTGGTSSLNRTVDRPDIIESATRLLDALGWEGYADLDYIQDPRDATAKVMEINPRVTGSVKIAFEAGVDFADLLVRHALGDPLPDYLDYRVGLDMRYLPLDILWFLRSPDRFRADPSWFRFFGRDLCYQVLSLRDPGPFLALAMGGIAKLLSPEVRAAKSGM